MEKVGKCCTSAVDSKCIWPADWGQLVEKIFVFISQRLNSWLGPNCGYSNDLTWSETENTLFTHWKSGLVFKHKWKTILDKPKSQCQQSQYVPAFLITSPVTSPLCWSAAVLHHMQTAAYAVKQGGRHRVETPSSTDFDLRDPSGARVKSVFVCSGGGSLLPSSVHICELQVRVNKLSGPYFIFLNVLPLVILYTSIKTLKTEAPTICLGNGTW